MEDSNNPTQEKPTSPSANGKKKVLPEQRQLIIELSAIYSVRKIAPRVGVCRQIVARVLRLPSPSSALRDHTADAQK